MATQAFAGFNGKLYISSDGGTTYDPIGEVRDATLTINQEEIDATSFDSVGWMENIVGLKSWELSAEALYLYGNTGQTELEDSLLNGTVVKFRFLPKTGTGNKGYVGDAMVTSYEVNNAVDDAVVLSLSIVGTASLATYTAA